MKKTIKGLVITVGCVFLLGACSETTTTKEEPKKEVTSKETEPKKEAQPKKEEPSKESEVILNEHAQADQAEQEYADNMSTYFYSFSDVMTRFSEQNNKAAQNPALMTDSDWMIDTSAVLIDMQSLIDEYRAIEDVPTAFEPSHELLGSVIDNYDFIVKNYATGIDNLDADLLSQCAQHMSTGTNILTGEYQTQMQADIQAAKTN